MKTRSIQTRFWDDEFVANATWQAKDIFIYILTSQYINLCGIFQLSDKKIMLESGLSADDFKVGTEELVKHKKIIFYGGWVCVANAFKNNRYWKSSKNWKAWEEEFSKINKEALAYFDTAMSTNIHTDQYSEISKQKAIASSQKRTTSEQKESDKKEEITTDWATENVK